MKRLIYVLKCPFTNDVHYVGKTTQGMIRPLQHLSESHSDKIRDWVDNLKQLGHKPEIEIMETVSNIDDIDVRERYWINKFLNDGAILLNSNLITPTLINSKLDEIIEGKYIDPVKRIGSFIKEKRKFSKLTQLELSQKSGVGLRFIREIEQGEDKGFNIAKIQTVLNLFNCTLDVIKIK